MQQEQDASRNLRRMTRAEAGEALELARTLQTMLTGRDRVIAAAAISEVLAQYLALYPQAVRKGVLLELLTTTAKLVVLRDQRADGADRRRDRNIVYPGSPDAPGPFPQESAEED